MEIGLAYQHSLSCDDLRGDDERTANLGNELDSLFLPSATVIVDGEALAIERLGDSPCLW
jgi:hypothetical protein